MAFTFPLSASVFASRLRVREVKFQLAEFVQMSITAGGDVIPAEIGRRKWRAEVSLVNSLRNDEAAEIQALLEVIGPAGKFYLFNPQKPFPRLDPTGTLLGGASPVIQSVGEDNVTLRVSGAPAGYRLSTGDLLHFDRAGGLRSMHRVAEDATAGPGGTIPFFTVRPPLKPGTVAGLAVTFRRPAARMCLMPGSFNPGTAGKLFTTGMAFTAIES